MELKDLIETLVGERIDSLLAEYQARHIEAYRKQLEREEGILRELNEEERKQIEGLIGELNIMEQDECVHIYLSALLDGFKIALWCMKQD